MKRILNGVTYNTETSTRLARSRWDGPNESEKFVETLYETRGGAYFLVQKHTVVEWDERERESAPRNESSFLPVSITEAHDWMLEGEVRVFHNPFGEDPPEATAEAQPGATIFVRLPATLKRAVDAAANEKKLSGNAWVMQCIERCLEGTSQFGGNEIASSLIQKLLDGDEELPIRFQKAKVFWTDFFKKNAQQPISALAKELGLQQGKFEAIFEDSERSFAKEMMPLTCLGVLYSNQKNQSLTRKVVEAFRKSDVSGEIKNAHLKAATQVFPID